MIAKTFSLEKVCTRLSAILVLAFLACARNNTAQAPAQIPVQTDDDEYTRYELLAPETQSFRIYYDVTATTPGAQYYFNGLRKGSEHNIHGVTDLMTGAPLEWKVVKGDVARENGLPRAAADDEFLQVKLARPVPAGGEARIRIDKTYKDAASYFREGDKIVFLRSLGIKRNSVVLPAAYELVGCNYPSQIRTEGCLGRSYPPCSLR